MAKTDTTKNAMIKALEKSLGVVTTVCRAVDLSLEVERNGNPYILTGEKQGAHA